MLKLFCNSQFHALNRRTFYKTSSIPILIQFNTFSQPPNFLQFFPNFVPLPPSRNLCIRAFGSLSSSSFSELKKDEEKVSSSSESEVDSNGSLKGSKVEYPSGEFEYKQITGWKSFVVKLKMLFAYPWERVRKGSVLTIKLQRQVPQIHFCLQIFGQLIRW